MPRYAVIDLGSNTIRLAVYDVRAGVKKPYSNKDFKSVIDKKKVAGLSAYVSDGLFSEEGIEKATDILVELFSVAKNLDCKNVKTFATAVIRNCKNHCEVVRQLEKETGAKIDVLTGEEEAHLGFVGATCDRKISEGMLIDIGGGSTELTSISKGKEVMNISLKQGSVSSYAEYVKTVFPKPREIAEIKQAFLGQMRDIDGIFDRPVPALYGIGGSVRAVAKMHARILGRDKASKELTDHDLEDILELLKSDISVFAHTAVKAAPDRLHSIVPGCIIAQTLMEKTGAMRLEICKYGVREGYLLSHLGKFGGN